MYTKKALIDALNIDKEQIVIFTGNNKHPPFCRIERKNGTVVFQTPNVMRGKVSIDQVDLRAIELRLCGAHV